MDREQRIQELREMYRDVEKTGRKKVSEICEDYNIVWGALHRIYLNIGWVRTFRVKLTQQQKEDIMVMVETITEMVRLIVSQIEVYEGFNLDDRGHSTSDEVKTSTLVDKVEELKVSVQKITQ